MLGACRDWKLADARQPADRREEAQGPAAVLWRGRFLPRLLVGLGLDCQAVLLSASTEVRRGGLVSPDTASQPDVGAAAQAELRRLARGFLAERYTLALATDGPEGLWVASLYFAGDLAELYFLSSPSSRHGRNLAANPRVAAAINEDEHDWRAIRGIQLEGACRPAHTPREYLRAWRAYLTKFPFVRQLLRRDRLGAADLAGKLVRTQMYCLRTDRLFYLDNRRGFGRRAELLDLAAD
jgi:uncharacterized protein